MSTAVDRVILEMRIHGADPCEIVAALDEPSLRIQRLIEELRTGWRRQAACSDQPLDMFFPTKGQRTQPAIDVCEHCPVRQPCLTEALADPDLDHGVRGGLTARQRQAHRRADEQRPPTPPRAGPNLQRSPELRKTPDFGGSLSETASSLSDVG